VSGDFERHLFEHYQRSREAAKGEKTDFLNWTKTSKYKQGNDYFRHNGGDETPVFSAADFEDFRQPRPDMPGRRGRGRRTYSIFSIVIGKSSTLLPMA
jgi:predicted amidohydrolase YtcJ